jgi:hypothetical protein
MPSNRRPAAGRRAQAALLLAAVLACHALSGNKSPWDSSFVLHQAYSILTEGNSDLVEWPDADFSTYRSMWIDGKPYSYFPSAGAVAAVPLVALLDVGLRVGAGRTYGEELVKGHTGDVQEFWASLLVAVAACFILAAGRRAGLDDRRALLLAAAFAFASPAWSTGSRALWSQTSLLLINASVVWMLAAGRRQVGDRGWLVLGLLLGFGCLVRPTGAAGAVGAAVVALGTSRRAFLRLAAGGAAMAVAGMLFNLHDMGRLLPPYFDPSRAVDDSQPLIAFAGHLFSPSRGVIIFVPWLLFAAAGLMRLLRADRVLGAGALAWLAIQVVLISTFGIWWGGHCYGPRFWTEVMPLLVMGLVPWLGAVRPGGRVASVLLVLSLAFAVGVHWVGANVDASLRWNRLPENVDTHRERLWDWSDPQFLRWQDPADPGRDT